MTAYIKSLCKSATHTMSKFSTPSIHLLEGLGVVGDAHIGVFVKHRSRVAQDPNQPNLRQIHLIHAELHDELREKGFDISPGQMGENITTIGIDLLSLPRHTLLHIGKTAVIEVTGLRNPCNQLNGIQEGLLKEVLDHDAQGNLIRKAGIMGVIRTGGVVWVGDAIRIELPDEPFLGLERV
jgi:hypothetical protein